jgi:Carboxypeptidase regulatory-like domain
MSPRWPRRPSRISPSSPPLSMALVLVVTAVIAWPVKDAVSRPYSQRAQSRASPEPSRRLSGTAAVHGQVLDAENGAPIRRAQVRASLVESGESWIATTDVNGRYELDRLPAGRYNMGAIRDGYVGLQLGQRWPHDQATTIQLHAHQLLERIDHRLPRTGVIAGHVVDEFADPQANVLVMALESRLANGRRVGVPGGRSTTTNDLGEFRLFGLTPGRYYVTARHREPTETTLSESKARFGFAPTYYPGTSRSEEAQTISVDAGEQVIGLALTMVSTRMFQITGAVRSGQGRSLVTNALTLVDSSALVRVTDAGAQRRSDGSFSIETVAPGNYVLNVRATAYKDGVVDGDEYAAVALTVTDADLTGIDVVTAKGATVNGEVVFEGGTVAPPQVARMTLLAVPVSGDIGLGVISAAHLKDDGRFEIRDLFGSRLFNLQGLPAGWELKSVELNGADILDTPTDLNGVDQRSQLRLVATNRLTELSGSVVGQPAGKTENCSVLIFSEDSRRWSVPSRYIRVARVDRGQFMFRGLPPGRYLAIASGDMTRESAEDPQFLESLRFEATPVLLETAESKSLQLTLSVGR